MCVGDLLKGIKVFSHGIYFKYYQSFLTNYNTDRRKFYNIEVVDHCEDLQRLPSCHLESLFTIIFLVLIVHLY